MADNCLWQDVNGGKRIPKRRQKRKNAMNHAEQLISKMCEAEPKLYEQILDSNMAQVFNQLCVIAIEAMAERMPNPEVDACRRLRANVVRDTEP